MSERESPYDESPYGSEGAEGASADPYGEDFAELEPDATVAFAPRSPAAVDAPAQGLLAALGNALRLASVHSVDATPTQEAAAELSSRLCVLLLEHSEVELELDPGRQELSLNGERVVVSTDPTPLGELVEQLDRLQVGGLIFRGDWTVGAVSSLLASALAGDPAALARDLPARAELRVSEALPPTKGGGVREARPSEAEPGPEGELGPEPGPAEQGLRLYARLRALLGRLHADSGQLAGCEHALRVTLMLLVERSEDYTCLRRLVSLSVLPAEADRPWAGHATNVCVLALGLGRLAGLDPQRLLELCWAAALHDLGRPETGRESALQRARERKETLQGHVAAGRRLAIRSGEGLDALTLAQAIVSHEHHACDGFPPRGEGRRPHVLTRLVGAADAFERATAGSPWAAPLSPAAALQQLREEGRHEQAVLDLLGDLLGQYPRGTLLRLEDQRLVVVIDGGPRRGNLPVVRALSGVFGATSEQGLELLSDPARATVLEPQQFTTDWEWQSLV